ncbi:MAG: hypothetical protein IT209_04200 [Armatimonadetes bacterium]|nr:hypothetical protein [Armatimonadota bacterium]
MSLRKLKSWLGMDLHSEEEVVAPASFVEQVTKLDSLGLHLNPGIEPEDLEGDWDADMLAQAEPFELAYISMGGDMQREGEAVPVSDQLFLLESGSISNPGDCARIITALARISAGEVKIQNASDTLQPGASKACVSFDVAEEHLEWDVRVTDGDVDATLFTQMVELTEKLGTRGRYTSFATGDDLVIGFATPEQLARLRKETSLDIVWLE